MMTRDNAEELALVAQEIGAEVIRGPMGYPARGSRQRDSSRPQYERRRSAAEVGIP